MNIWNNLINLFLELIQKFIMPLMIDSIGFFGGQQLDSQIKLVAQSLIDAIYPLTSVFDFTIPIMFISFLMILLIAKMAIQLIGIVAKIFEFAKVLIPLLL